jgi:hypothetical protein
MYAYKDSMEWAILKIFEFSLSDVVRPFFFLLGTCGPCLARLLFEGAQQQYIESILDVELELYV